MGKKRRHERVASRPEASSPPKAKLPAERPPTSFKTLSWIAVALLLLLPFSWYSAGLGFPSLADLAYSMGLVVAAWVVLALMHLGLGRFVSLSLGSALCRGDLSRSFWLGWGLTLAILNLWNLFWRVDGLAFACLAALSGLGLVLDRKPLLAAARQGVLGHRRLGILVVSLGCLVLYWANQSIFAPQCYDAGLYHFASIRWAEHFPAVPGLGNLHGRLAFNQAPFLYFAMVDWGPWDSRSHNVVNGLLMSAWCGQALISVMRLSSRLTIQEMFPDLFRVLLTLGVVLYVLWYPCVSSPTPDIAALVIGAVLAAEFVELLFAEAERRVSVFLPVFLALMASVAVIVKLSFIILGPMVALCAFAVRCKRANRSGHVIAWSAIGRRVAAVLGAGTVIILVPWMIRGIVLSGYPAYPVRFGAMPVDWRMSDEAVLDMARQVAAWARAPGAGYAEVLGPWAWLGPWWRRMQTPLGVTLATAPSIVFVVASSLGLAIRHFLRRSSHLDGLPWLVLVPPLVSAVFWFYAAPNIRFAGVMFWTLAVGAALLLIREIGGGLSGRRGILVAAVGCAAIVLYVAANRAQLPVRPGLRGAGPERGFYAIPRRPLREYRTLSGLMLYVPDGGDQCWDAPLPCTPEPDPHLRLRRDGDVGGGFAIQRESFDE